MDKVICFVILSGSPKNKERGSEFKMLLCSVINGLEGKSEQQKVKEALKKVPSKS